MSVEYFVNKKGGKVYFDSKNQPRLDIKKDRRNIFNILSVGFNRENKPLITIKMDNDIVCYLLPDELINWVKECVSIAMLFGSAFPCEVEFGYREDGSIWVEIL